MYSSVIAVLVVLSIVMAEFPSPGCEAPREDCVNEQERWTRLASHQVTMKALERTRLYLVLPDMR